MGGAVTPRPQHSLLAVGISGLHSKPAPPSASPAQLCSFLVFILICASWGPCGCSDLLALGWRMEQELPGVRQSLCSPGSLATAPGQACKLAVPPLLPKPNPACPQPRHPASLCTLQRLTGREPRLHRGRVEGVPQLRFCLGRQQQGCAPNLGTTAAPRILVKCRFGDRARAGRSGSPRQNRLPHTAASAFLPSVPRAAGGPWLPALWGRGWGEGTQKPRNVHTPSPRAGSHTRVQTSSLPWCSHKFQRPRPG